MGYSWNLKFLHLEAVIKHFTATYSSIAVEKIKNHYRPCGLEHKSDAVLTTNNLGLLHYQTCALLCTIGAKTGDQATLKDAVWSLAIKIHHGNIPVKPTIQGILTKEVSLKHIILLEFISFTSSLNSASEIDNCVSTGLQGNSTATKNYLQPWKTAVGFQSAKTASYMCGREMGCFGLGELEYAHGEASADPLEGSSEHPLTSRITNLDMEGSWEILRPARSSFQMRTQTRACLKVK